MLVSLEAKSATIATYAMCGFSNFGMIGITLGGLTLLAPQKEGLIDEVGRIVDGGRQSCLLHDGSSSRFIV